jgi:RNA polymerase sigma-70 factor (sigma-E family)
VSDHATDGAPLSLSWCDSAARSNPVVSRRDEEFRAFLADRRSSLLRTSTALTGGDPHLAEDLVQKCVIKLYVAWPRVRSMHLDSYVRRSLVNALIDERRGAFWRHERAWAEPPDAVGPEVVGGAGAGGGDEGGELSGDVLWALGQLGPRMRAAVVLRHVEGLSTAETAHALRCSTGTVKSQTARGLERLRALLGDGADHPASSNATDATDATDSTNATGATNRRAPSYQGENNHD